MSRILNQDVISGGVLIIVAIILFINTFEFGSSEAAMFPRGLIYLLFLMSILIIIGGIRKAKQSEDETKTDVDTEQRPMNSTQIKNTVLTLSLVILYAFMIYTIGFFPATTVFITLFLLYMGVKNWKPYVFTVIGLNLFIYLLFVVQLNVRLPMGILFN